MLLKSVIVSVLFAIINFLLMACTSRLLKRPIKIVRVICAAVIVGGYVLTCLMLENPVINNWKIYILMIYISSIVSFGFARGWFASSAVYTMLVLSLGGIHVGTRGMISLLIGSCGIMLVFLIGQYFPGKDIVDVQINYRNNQMKFNALIDSGNFLVDPLTGKSVLIVDAIVAQQLTGLSVSQLRAPVESLSEIDGYRLLPYNTIGEKGRFLLAKRMEDVHIGSWKGSVLVAFSPELLSSNKRFQALIGGRA